MKNIAPILIVMLLLFAASRAEEALLLPEQADPSALYEFADAYDAKQDIQRVFEAALSGEELFDAIWNALKARFQEPIRWAVQASAGMLAPVLLIALLRCGARNKPGSSSFLVQIVLIRMFAEIAIEAVDSSAMVLQAAKSFTDISAPGLITLISALGMDGTAAIASPAAALAGNSANVLFRKYGLKLCRIALCTAIAGNLSSEINLNKLTSLFRKTVNWGCGFAVAVFTALLALQGRVAEGLDGVAVRTAKYAVDSAAPIIGSGISDAWESYVSGVLIAQNALGVSGIAVLLVAGIGSFAKMLLAILVLNIASAILDVFGAHEASRAAEQIGGICQMSLSICTAATAIVMVLLGALMSAGTGALG